MPFIDAQLNMLDAGLEASRLKKRRMPDGRTIDYIEGFEVIDQANRIFGYGQWGYSTDKPYVLEEGQSKSGTPWQLWAALVTVEVVDCLPVTELGTCPRQGAPGEANLDMAIKGAVTDGLKRALRHFGNQFGNPLYDKDFVAEQDNQQGQQQQRPAQPAQPLPPTQAAQTQAVAAPAAAPAPAPAEERYSTPGPATTPPESNVPAEEKNKILEELRAGMADKKFTGGKDLRRAIGGPAGTVPTTNEILNWLRPVGQPAKTVNELLNRIADLKAANEGQR